MTTTAAPLAPSADSLALPALPPEAAARLERIRPHTVGLTPSALTALVEQAFRNVPAINTEQIVHYLTASPA